MIWNKIEKINLPNDKSWVIIKSRLKHLPKYEVCFYNDDEWYLPSIDDVFLEEDIIEWAYIEK